MADRVAAELRALGLEVAEDDAGAEVGADARQPARADPRARGATRVLLCAHLDTVPHDGADRAGRSSTAAGRAPATTILGADNKAAVAMLLELARRAAIEGSPVGVELLFTVSEENALAGAKAFDVGALRCRRSATSSTTRRRSARSSSPRRPTTALAGRLPRRAPRTPGSAPRRGAARSSPPRAAIAAMPLGPHRRRDDGERRHDRRRRRAARTSCPSAAASSARRARSTTRRVEEARGRDRRPRCTTPRTTRSASATSTSPSSALFDGLPPQDRPRRRCVAAEAALRALRLRAAAHPQRRRRRTPTRSRPAGFTCVNLANGTERNHEPTERVSQVARWRACST